MKLTVTCANWLPTFNNHPAIPAIELEFEACAIVFSDKAVSAARLSSSMYPNSSEEILISTSNHTGAIVSRSR